MKLIVVVDKNWGIGKNGGLLFSLPGDMAHFRKATTGHALVMGRKTLESFPGGRPLKNRLNLVLSGDAAYRVEGASVYHSMGDLRGALRQLPAEDIYVIGGGSVYRALYPYCSEAIVTRVDADGGADTFFPDLEAEGWKLAAQSEPMEENGLKYRFCTYQNPCQKDFFTE